MTKKIMIAAVLAVTAVAADAKPENKKDAKSPIRNVKTTLDIRTPPIAKTSPSFLGFGYVDDPVIGGEETVLKYRQAGAWLLKTRKCDDETLRFLKKNKITILLVLDGARESIMADLKRIEDGGFESAVAGFVLGDDPAGGGDAEKWRSVVTGIKRRFDKKPIGIPAKNARPPMAKMLAAQMKLVSHYIFDLSGEKEPYRKLKSYLKGTASGSSKNLAHIRHWVIAPDRMPGSPESTRSEFKTMSWKIHWLMAAYATESVDTVIFNQPMKSDEFGSTLRYLGLAFRDHPYVMAHGETKSMDTMKGKNNSPDLEQDFDDVTGGFGGDDNFEVVVRPKACGNVADGKTGDVEYLVLRNGGDRICLVMVNTSGKRSYLTVDLKSKKTGNCTYRRMFIDPRTKKVTREAMGSFSQPGFPFVAAVDPDCIETITVILTIRNHNQAGY